MTIASAVAQQASGNQMCIPGMSVPHLSSDHVHQWTDRLHEHPLLHSKRPLPKYYVREYPQCQIATYNFNP